MRSPAPHALRGMNNGAVTAAAPFKKLRRFDSIAPPLHHSALWGRAPALRPTSSSPPCALPVSVMIPGQSSDSADDAWVNGDLLAHPPPLCGAGLLPCGRRPRRPPAALPE